MDLIRKVLTNLRIIKADMSKASEQELKIVARKIAMAEMELQAVRSLLEARLFEAEVDYLEDDNEASKL